MTLHSELSMSIERMPSLSIIIISPNIVSLDDDADVTASTATIIGSGRVTVFVVSGVADRPQRLQPSARPPLQPLQIQAG